MVDNSDGFFNDLPVNYSKSKGGVRSLLPKDLLINHKILMEQQKAERAQERVLMLRTQQEERKQKKQTKAEMLAEMQTTIRN